MRQKSFEEEHYQEVLDYALKLQAQRDELMKFVQVCLGSMTEDKAKKLIEDFKPVDFIIGERTKPNS